MGPYIWQKKHKGRPWRRLPLDVESGTTRSDRQIFSAASTISEGPSYVEMDDSTQRLSKVQTNGVGQNEMLDDDTTMEATQDEVVQDELAQNNMARVGIEQPVAPFVPPDEYPIMEYDMY